MNDLKRTIKALVSKGFKAVLAADAAKATAYVLSVIGKDETVGMGGSVTLFETGIADALLARGNTVSARSQSAQAKTRKKPSVLGWARTCI